MSMLHLTSNCTLHEYSHATVLLLGSHTGCGYPCTHTRHRTPRTPQHASAIRFCSRTNHAARGGFLIHGSNKFFLIFLILGFSSRGFSALLARGASGPSVETTDHRHRQADTDRYQQATFFYSRETSSQTQRPVWRGAAGVLPWRPFVASLPDLHQPCTQ
jgi:hypothetical protein